MIGLPLMKKLPHKQHLRLNRSAEETAAGSMTATKRLAAMLLAAITPLAFIADACAKPSYANRSAQQIIASGSTPEDIGLALVTEADERDFGYGDMEVELEMVLRNAQGEESRRYQRSRNFEMIDPSVGDKTMIIFDRPRDVKGTAFLTFSKILEPDDQWLYLPSLKRVKRIASKNKSGPFVGSEFAYEDISSQEVGKYSYKYLRSEPCPKSTQNGGDVTLCVMIERFPNYEYSGYTKQVAWLDVEELRLLKIDFYDRKEALLKTLTYNDYHQYLNRYWRANHFHMVNHQNGKSTDLYWKNYRFRTGLKEEDFDKEVLKQVR